MSVLAALFMLAAPASGAPAPIPSLTVPDLVQRHVTLTGRTARVRGRFAVCQPLSCGLLDDQKLTAPIAWLSFEHAPAFDAAAHSDVGWRVIVECIVLGQGRSARIVRVLDAAR